MQSYYSYTYLASYIIAIAEWLLPCAEVSCCCGSFSLIGTTTRHYMQARLNSYLAAWTSLGPMHLILASSFLPTNFREFPVRQQDAAINFCKINDYIIVWTQALAFLFSTLKKKKNNWVHTIIMTCLHHGWSVLIHAAHKHVQDFILGGGSFPSPPP